MQFFNALVTSLLVATAVALPAPDAQTVEKRACDPEQCRKTVRREPIFQT